MAHGPHVWPVMYLCTYIFFDEGAKISMWSVLCHCFSVAEELSG